MLETVALGAMLHYTVQPGNTLSGIALQHGVSVTQLEQANPQISDPNFIFVGQLVNIPAYEVKPGDTLWAIARAHGVALSDLEQANPQFAADYNLIFPGQMCVIPVTAMSDGSVPPLPQAAVPVSDEPEDSAPSSPAPSAPAPPPAAAPTAAVNTGSYVNPLGAISGLQAERIDQGVDYGGTGPLRALGGGTVVVVFEAGWPNGVFLEVHLSDGPFAGKYVYYAEDITPSVSVGQQVSTGQVIGQMNGSIEIGWGDPGVIGNAAAHDIYTEGSSTAFGADMSAFLQSLGAPAGTQQTALEGSVPPGYFRSGPVAAAAAVPVPPGSAASFPSGTDSQNLVSIGRFLVSHGYSHAAAAGVASCIAGESGGNPESVGSGGGGLIGWTPLSSLFQYGGTIGGDPTADFNSQLNAILNYNNVNDGGNLSALKTETDPLAAADFYSQNFERPAVTNSDVVPSVALAVFQALGS